MKCCPSLNLQILINYFCYRQTLISLVINARSSTVLLRNKVLYCLRSSKVVPQGQQSKHHLYHGQYMPEGIFFSQGPKENPHETNIYLGCSTCLDIALLIDTFWQGNYMDIAMAKARLSQSC